MTTRRSFLASVAAALAGAAAFEKDPERALWVPGKKLISVPAPGPYCIDEEFVRCYILPAIRFSMDSMDRLLMARYHDLTMLETPAWPPRGKLSVTQWP